MGQTSETKPYKTSAGPFVGLNTIYGANGDRDTPYMTRAWLGRLRLHIFHRGDADPDCHDHPWDFWTFPLTSYVEEVATPNGYGGFTLTRQVVKAWRLQYRPATHCHRVIGRFSGHYLTPVRGLPISADFAEGLVDRHPNFAAGFTDNPETDGRKIVTLVWRGKSGRKWGFLKLRDGRWCWTPWKEYVFGGGKTAPCAPEGGDE